MPAVGDRVCISLSVHIFNKALPGIPLIYGGIARVGIKYIDVADEDAFHRAHGRSLRAAHPGS
jgi:hypothetical protein